MSEPMSSVEIEDVLSSIRRLVSEDMRPAASPPVRPAPEAAVPAQPQSAAQLAASKLILTPALRVVSDDVPVAARSAEPVPAPSAEHWDDGEVAAFVNVEDDAVFDDGAHTQPAAEVVSLTPPVPPSRLDPEGDRLGDHARDVAAEPRPAAAPELAAPVVEASEVVPVADALAWGTPPDGPLPEWEDAQPESVPFAEDAAQQAAHDPALDALWADAAEAEVLRQLAEEAGPAQAEPPSEDDMIYEENLLRDLVRDIIREELQGELGERITRNVRKLVRAEIARAMALRDFD